MNIGNRLKEIRKNHNLTQKELGKLVGKSEITIRKYENDERNPPLDVILKICKELGLDSHELMLSYWGYSIDNKKLKEELEEIDRIKGQSYLIEKYIYSLGYQFVADSEGNFSLHTPTGEYEANIYDLEELETSTKSFVQFKLSEIMAKSRKLGK